MPEIRLAPRLAYGMLASMLFSQCSLPVVGRSLAGVGRLTMAAGFLLLLGTASSRAQFPTTRQAVSAFTPPPVSNVPAASVPAAPAPATAAGASAGGANASYSLSPNDTVLVEVYQEDDLRTMTRISQEGTISVPLIGTVKVGGLTQGQARDRIADLLRARFLVNPQVSLTVAGFASKRFTILGQVNRPGTYELPPQEKIDLLEAIAMAGGFTRIAKGSNVTIRRRVGDADKILTVNADKQAKNTSEERFMINPGDDIRVAESIF